MILELTATVLLFTPSPTPGAVHRCQAFELANVPAPCPPGYDPPCEERVILEAPCPVGELEPGTWRARTNATPPGHAIAFCIYAENASGPSDCAEPVSWEPGP